MDSVPFLKYTLLRIGVFLVVFLGLYFLLGWNIIVAALVGLVIAFAVSYLFFDKLRVEASQQVAERMSAKGRKAVSVVDHDAEAEDAFQETLVDPYAGTSDEFEVDHSKDNDPERPTKKRKN